VERRRFSRWKPCSGCSSNQETCLESEPVGARTKEETVPGKERKVAGKLEQSKNGGSEEGTGENGGGGRKKGTII